MTVQEAPDREKFKDKVFEWLSKQQIVPNKIRFYNTRRYGLEARIYHGTVKYTSSRISFRETSRDDKTRYGTRGHHNIVIPLYTAISEKDFENEEEMAFILQVLKDNIV